MPCFPHNESVELIEVSVKLPSGDRFPVVVALDNPVSEVLAIFAVALDVSVDQQRLLFKGTQLTPCFTFRDYQIEDGARLHLVLELQGGGPSQRVEPQTVPRVRCVERLPRTTLLSDDPLLEDSADSTHWQGHEEIFGGELELDPAPACSPMWSSTSDGDEATYARSRPMVASDDDSERAAAVTPRASSSSDDDPPAVSSGHTVCDAQSCGCCFYGERTRTATGTSRR